jgi:alkylation response protein AidB-like acyl-CoA dehydrogenase
MEFEFSEKEEAFRKEVQEFFKANLPKRSAAEEEEESDSDASFARAKEFSIKLAKKGWLALHWPKQYGGYGASPMEQLVYAEESTKASVPGDTPAMMAVTWVGPTLLLAGTEEQKKKFIPKILSREIGFCTLYSEPEAGSDLASLRTRAVLDSDEYVVNGQKVWNSGAHRADWGWLAARTDPDAPKHKGISLFMLDMKTPGVTVKPLINMAGTHEFNEVFFENARIPKANLVGELNRGWYTLAVALDFERSGTGRFISMQKTIAELTDYCRKVKVDGKPLADNPVIRHELAQRAIEIEVGRWLAYRVAWLQGKGQPFNKEASMGKVIGSETNQRLMSTAHKILGMYGQLAKGSKHAPLNGKYHYGLLRAVANTIEAGTSEIQRNILATRGLGLPRG